MGRTATATISLGRFVFIATLPTVTSKVAGTAAFWVADLVRFERAVAKWVIEHGAMSPETFRLLRKTANLSLLELGELLGKDKAEISRWENGYHKFSVCTWNTVADLALDAMGGKQNAAGRLRAIVAAKKHSQRPIKIAV